MVKRLKLASALLVCVPLCLTHLAHAQTHTARIDDADRKEIEEGSLPDANLLPLTISVVDSAAIKAMNPDDGSEALKNVAGISSQNAKGAENGSISIRGVKLNPFSSYRLNGGLPIAGVITTPKEDKESLAVLKGANALFFGVASPGGVVDLITKRAGDADVSQVELYASSFGQYGASYDIGRQFGDERQFGMRANLSAVHAENGVDGANGHGSFGSVAVDWKAGDRLSFGLDAERYRRNVVEQANIQPTLVGANTKIGIAGAYLVPNMPDPTKLMSGPWDVYTPITTNLDLRARYDLADSWEVFVEAGRSDSSRSRIQSRILNYNLTTGAGTANSTLFNDQEYINTFGRLEANGKLETGSLKHALTVGVSSSERFFNGASSSNSVSAPQNIFNPIRVPKPIFAAAPQSFKAQDPRDFGIYTYDSVQIGAQWNALVGLRQTKDIADNVNVANGPHVITASTVVTPAIGFMYRFAARTTAYTSYMKGLEDGAQAPLQAKNAFVVLASSLSVQKELGVRSAYFNGISASLAYFDLTQSNATLNPTTNVFGADGTLSFKGVESTVNIDFNPWWSLNGAGQILNAAQNTVNDRLAAGKSPENMPRLSGNVNVAHKFLAVPGLTLSAGASYTGFRYIGTEEQGHVPGFALFNAGAVYVTQLYKHKTAFQMTVDNLFNKAYWNSATSTALGMGMVRGIKMNVKIDL